MADKQETNGGIRMKINNLLRGFDLNDVQKQAIFTYSEAYRMRDYNTGSNDEALQAQRATISGELASAGIKEPEQFFNRIHKVIDEERAVQIRRASNIK